MDELRVIASTPDAQLARNWGLVLEAVALPHRVVDRAVETLPFEPDADHDERYVLVVSAEDVDRAHAILDAEREEEIASAKRRPFVPEPPRASDGRAWAVTLLLCAVLVLVYLRSPGFESDISRALRVDADRIRAGEWWRLIGGAWLHSDPGHLAGNISFLLPLGYFCVRRFGAGALLFGFVATAAFGFGMSVYWHGPYYRSVGASGGMFGLFGLLVGAALAEDAPHRDPKQRRRELIGAALGLLGMTAFGRVADDPNDIFARAVSRTDIAAHVFGFLGGLVIGASLIRVRRRWAAFDASIGLLAAICVALALLSACGPTGGGVRSEVLVPSGKGYALQEVVLPRVTNLARLEGEGLVFSADTRFSVDIDVSNRTCQVSGVPCISTAERIRDAVVVNPKTPVQPRFGFVDGVQKPLDFDSLNLVTAYYHLAEAEAYFGALGVDAGTPAPVYYFPNTSSLHQFGLGDTDNAAYFRLADGFLLLPMRTLRQVPLSMNRGVMFHEYFHRIFSTRIFGLRPFTALLVSSEEEARASLRLSALDEGLADFFGAVATGDPRFIAPSAPMSSAIARDLSISRTFEASWLTTAEPRHDDFFDPYLPGSCFAHWLWRLRELLGEQAVIDAWFRADLKIRDAELGTLEYGVLVSLIAEELPGSCESAREIFAALEIPACP